MTETIGRIAVGTLLALVLGVSVAAGGDAQTPPPGQAPPGQSEFVPVDELPAADQLPAAPLLIAAYAVAWVALLVYVWALWRRLGRVEKEMADLMRRIGTGQRG